MSEVQQTVAPVAVPPAPVAPPAAPVVATPTVVVPPVQAVPPGQPEPSATEAKGAPESYAEFKAPEGMQVNKDLVASFGPIAKELGLTQDAAQKLVTYQMESMKQEIASYEARLTSEKASIPSLMAKDPTLGGANAVANLATMQRALVAFGSPELTTFLDAKETGPDIYLHFARFAYKVGAAIKEDSVAGTSNSVGSQKSDQDKLRALYPNSPELFGDKKE